MASVLPAIQGYHAHVYYDFATREQAAALREALASGFEVALGRWHDALVGPHTRSMYQVAFAPDQFAALVPFLMLSHGDLAVLVHAETGDDLADHTRHAFWLGQKLALRLDVLRQGPTG